jgi:YHS domain-containing protein
MTWLIRFLLLSILFTLVLRSLRQLFRSVMQGMGVEQGSRPPRAVDRGVRMVRDPICGTHVIPGNSLAVRDRDGLHCFCSDTCRDAFLGKARRPAGR